MIRFKVSPNFEKRTFTIRKKGTKFRTYPLSVHDFYLLLEYNENQWNHFLATQTIFNIIN